MFAGIQHISWFHRAYLAFAMLAALCGCGETQTPSSVNVIQEAPGFPPVPFPEWNVPSAEKIELGRHLFYDTGLSSTGTVSCASCHNQSNAFSDAKGVSTGVRGEVGSRNAQSIVNTAYQSSWFWDGRALTLEQQIATALQSPFEMHADTAAVREHLTSSPVYPAMFARSFGSQTPLTLQRAVEAIATFCRTLISGNSRYDRFIMGERDAMNEEEKEGMRLFFSDLTKCSSCHSGFNFSDNDFHSVALHAHYYDRGRAALTKRERDIGKFKTPTLRNIERSAPYMNEGLMLTLEEVVEHYNAGGRPFVYKDTSLIKPLNLSAVQKRALVAFLRSLTDEDFLNNPAFRNPHR